MKLEYPFISITLQVDEQHSVGFDFLIKPSDLTDLDFADFCERFLAIGFNNLRENAKDKFPELFIVRGV